MNPGNNKYTLPKSKLGGVDNFVERLNKGFGRLLGKRGHSLPPKQTSNATFSVIMLVACLLLWVCTGFYFIGEKEYGIILMNGRVVDVNKGIKVGITFPYPFGDVEIIDVAQGNVTTIGESGAKPLLVLDQNLSPVSISAKFSYQIYDPKILYQKHQQDQDTFDAEVLWQVQSQIRDVIAKKSASELKATNFTVLSNEISSLLNARLALYGITLNKFTIFNIQETRNTENQESQRAISSIGTQKQPLSVQLQLEAAIYNKNQLTRALSQSKEFNSLLPAYRQNASQVMTKMYNETLSKIPSSHIEDKYKLLFLDLKELKQLENAGIDQHVSNSSGRVFTREVTRDRTGMDN